MAEAAVAIVQVSVKKFNWNGDWEAEKEIKKLSEWKLKKLKKIIFCQTLDYSLR